MVGGGRQPVGRGAGETKTAGWVSQGGSGRCLNFTLILESGHVVPKKKKGDEEMLQGYALGTTVVCYQGGTKE